MEHGKREQAAAILRIAVQGSPWRSCRDVKLNELHSRQGHVVRNVTVFDEDAVRAAAAQAQLLPPVVQPLPLATRRHKEQGCRGLPIVRRYQCFAHDVGRVRRS